MRVLVTGAAGFVGSEVVRHLAGRQLDVTAVDRNQEALQQSVTGLSGVSAAALDLADSEAVRALFAEHRPEGLIHLAWYANPTDYLTAHANVASLEMTVALTQAALAAGCRKFVIGGSCVEYAARDRLLLETDPVEPRTLYAACKHAAWQVVRILAAEAQAELAWARIFHMHGPGEHPSRLIPWVARELKAGAVVPLTDGSQVRDHLHVADAASALVEILLGQPTGIYNVCSGQPVTLRHVLEIVGGIVGGVEQLRFGALPHRTNETMFLAGNPGRLLALGWAPRFGLRDGLADALAGVF